MRTRASLPHQHLHTCADLPFLKPHKEPLWPHTHPHGCGRCLLCSESPDSPLRPHSQSHSPCGPGQPRWCPLPSSEAAAADPGFSPQRWAGGRSIPGKAPPAGLPGRVCPRVPHASGELTPYRPVRASPSTPESRIRSLPDPTTEGLRRFFRGPNTGKIPSPAVPACLTNPQVLAHPHCTPGPLPAGHPAPNESEPRRTGSQHRIEAS